MRWPWTRRKEDSFDPRDPEWDETERKQQECMVRERRERRALEARIDAVLRDFEALADPRVIRRLRGRY